MNHFEGRYYDGISARATGVRVSVQPDGRLRIEGEGLSRELELDGVSVSERLGTTPRTLRLLDGASVELPDSDQLDEALRSVAVRGAPRFVFLLVAVTLSGSQPTGSPSTPSEDGPQATISSAATTVGAARFNYGWTRKGM